MCSPAFRVIIRKYRLYVKFCDGKSTLFGHPQRVTGSCEVTGGEEGKIILEEASLKSVGVVGAVTVIHADQSAAYMRNLGGTAETTPSLFYKGADFLYVLKSAFASIVIEAIVRVKNLCT